MNILRFLCDARAGATAMVSTAVVVITVGASALVTDHKWLVDQRDVLKSAADAAGIAATLEMTRILDAQPTISDADLRVALEPVARRYVELNLGHLSRDRYDQAIATLVVDIVLQRARRTVDVSAEADLGGTLLAHHIPIFESAVIPKSLRVATQVESVTTPIEVVLAIDVSTSMDRMLDGSESTCAYCLEQWYQDLFGTNIDADRDSANRRIEIVKRAARNLVDILGPGAENRVAVGVVPWHTQVRLDSDAISEWTRLGWAKYPTRRVYGEPYACRGDNCTPPAPVEQTLASAAPEDWKGCLDTHRMGSVGTRASVPDSSEFFTRTFEQRVRSRVLHRLAGRGVRVPDPSLPLRFELTIPSAITARKYKRWDSIDADPYDPQYEVPGQPLPRSCR